MKKLLCFLIYADFISQRLLNDDQLSYYIVPSREFLLAIIATLLCKHSDNRDYCIVAAWFWLDFINQVFCEFTELEYFGVMAVVCVSLKLRR